MDGSTLVNEYTGKCLSVYSHDPPRVDQSSKCATRWAFTRGSQLVDVASGLCLYVDGRVTGKDRDANFTQWPQSANSDWNTYAGTANGAHLSLMACSRTGAVEASAQWIEQPAGASGSFALRSALEGSMALVGGVASSCGDRRSGQTCTTPAPSQAAQWPRWVLANRAAATLRGEKAA